MSLNDELTDAVRKKATVGEWIAQWYSTLSVADKKSWDAWVADPTKASSAMWRVMRNHGFTGCQTSVRDWARSQRDSR